MSALTDHDLATLLERAMFVETALERVADALERQNDLHEYELLRSAGHQAATEDRKRELSRKLWPLAPGQTIRAEHQANPMNHIGRVRKPGT